VKDYKKSDNLLHRVLLSPMTTIGAFALAVVLLGISGIGGARAALQYYSENYESHLEMYDIGVSLLENEDRVSFRDYVQNSDGVWSETEGTLLTHMLDAIGENGEPVKDENGNIVTEELKIGDDYKYKEELSIMNSGSIDQYARVSIYKYWEKDGKKLTNLSPDLIHLNFVNCDGANADWAIDENASTDERTVLYYRHLLKAGETSSIFTDTLSIDGMLASKKTVHKSEPITDKDGRKKTVITTSYDYDGVRFCIEATVDAVQEHNVSDAILSAWGGKVTSSNAELSLIK